LTMFSCYGDAALVKDASFASFSSFVTIKTCKTWL